MCMSFFVFFANIVAFLLSGVFIVRFNLSSLFCFVAIVLFAITVRFNHLAFGLSISFGGATFEYYSGHCFPKFSTLFLFLPLFVVAVGYC